MYEICCTVFVSSKDERYGILLFNIIFDNISVITWQLVLLVEKTKISSENQRPVASDYTLYHIVFTTLVVIATYCIGRFKTKYHRAPDEGEGTFLCRRTHFFVNILIV